MAFNLNWDAENIRHLKRHGVTPAEFEQVMGSDPVLVEYQTTNAEARYKILGQTRTGRVLFAVWTPRGGRVRAITAYRASRAYKELYWRSRE